MNYNKWLQLFDEVPVEKLHKIHFYLEKSEDYEACDKLKKYIDSRIRDNKLKEILEC